MPEAPGRDGYFNTKRQQCQMVFNIAIRNRDDYAKNFSFRLINGEWGPSPAYDLLPSNELNGFHTTTINNNCEAALLRLLRHKDSYLIGT